MSEPARNESGRPTHCTYAEFLARGEAFGHAEWVDGRVEFMSPVSGRHDELRGYLYAVLRAFVEVHDLGIVRGPEFQMKTGPDLPGREPDVLFLAAANRDREKPSHIDGPADLVIEVVSTDDPERDYATKRLEYESGGVREYWIVDPRIGAVEFLRLGPDGRFASAEPDVDGIYRSSTVSGFWIRCDWLWRQPLPTLVATLRELRC